MKGTASIVIEAPQEEVWVYIADVRNMPGWVRGVSDPRLTPYGPFLEGSTFSMTYAYGRRSHTIQCVVSGFDPPERFSFRSVEAPFPFASTVELEPTDSGIKVRATIDAGADSRLTSLTFALFWPLVRFMMKRQIGKQVKTLKRILERDE